MRFSRRGFLATTAAAASMSRLPLAGAANSVERKTRNVVLVTLDGLRPEEVFSGAEESLLTKRAGVTNEAAARAAFWRETPEQRRAALMPFLWSTIATEGQIYGDVENNSRALLTNGKKFSYPGYSEILTGAPDDRIDSNDKVPNPNINVLEWLNQQDDLRGRVAAFGCWDVFPFILNTKRSGLLAHAGWEPIPGDSSSEARAVLNRLLETLPREWPTSHYDALAYEAALDHIKTHSPRVIWLGFGETDEYAHEGKYDKYLDAARRSDRMIEHLWLTLQGMPEYQGTTSLVVTVDHGRGGLPDGWRNHGASVEGAEKIWVAALGPDTPALGSRKNVELVRQSQIAATVAALLGKDFCAAKSDAAPPIADIVGS